MFFFLFSFFSSCSVTFFGALQLQCAYVVLKGVCKRGTRECAHVVLKGGAGVQSPRNMYQCQMGKQTMGTALSTHVIPIYRALINIHFVAKSSQLTIHVITMNSIRPIVRCMCALRSPVLS